MCIERSDFAVSNLDFTLASRERLAMRGHHWLKSGGDGGSSCDEECLHVQVRAAQRTLPLLITI